MNEGTSPPLGRGGCAPKKMVPFLSGADGEGRRLFQVGSVSDLPGRAAFSVALQGYAARPPLLEGGEMALFVFGLPASTIAIP